MLYGLAILSYKLRHGVLIDIVHINVEDLFINLTLIQKNQLYGRDGKPPLTYKGCMEVATKVLAANKIAHTMIYTTGDPYVGPSTAALEKKTKRVVELEKENKSLRGRIRELESRY